jgi:hypothetical protein
VTSPSVCLAQDWSIYQSIIGKTFGISSQSGQLFQGMKLGCGCVCIQVKGLGCYIAVEGS